MKYLQMSFLLLLLTTFSFCSKQGSTSESNGTPPSDLSVSATVSTDSSGNVTFTSSAANAVSYDYNFGNGIYQTVPLGVVSYKYPASGSYTVNVTAKSAGGLTLSKSVQVNVAVAVVMLWSDEFSTTGSPDPAKWGYDIGTGSGGWGNKELEYYTNRTTNAAVSNGTLKIIALRENYSGSAYTSARLLTKDKFSFKYGKIEVRAKLPAGAGAWPAIWMLGNNFQTAPWPACGEIDIMEQKGSEPDKIYSTLHHPGHSGGNGDGSTRTISNATTDFHLYAAEWSATTIKFLIDDVVYYTFSNYSSLPFNQNFFVILNVAMGGNFAGSVDPSVTSAIMEIDYVRVYQ
ncbi:MAG: family 16 glycosylhydrolase [Segetibacter sp.]